MASNQTQNYGLNQWEATDQVLRTEFNADNQKIDAALFSRLGPIELIQNITMELTNTRKIGFDLTDFDWSKWSIVAFDCHLEFQNLDNSCSTTLDLDGITKTGSAGYMSPPTDTQIVFFPGRDADRPVYGLGFPGGTFVRSQDPYRNITRFGFGVNMPTTFQAGSTITLYGIH